MLIVVGFTVVMWAAILELILSTLADALPNLVYHCRFGITAMASASKEIGYDGKVLRIRSEREIYEFLFRALKMIFIGVLVLLLEGFKEPIRDAYPTPINFFIESQKFNPEFDPSFLSFLRATTFDMVGVALFMAMFLTAIVVLFSAFLMSDHIPLITRNQTYEIDQLRRLERFLESKTLRVPGEPIRSERVEVEGRFGSWMRLIVAVALLLAFFRGLDTFVENNSLMYK